MATYNIEQGLRHVETWLRNDPDNAQLQVTIENWRVLMTKLSTESPVLEFLTLDMYAWREALIEGTPLAEMRSVDQYHCWMAIERYTRDVHNTRFFDLCKVA